VVFYNTTIEAGAEIQELVSLCRSVGGRNTYGLSTYSLMSLPMYTAGVLFSSAAVIWATSKCGAKTNVLSSTLAKASGSLKTS